MVVPFKINKFISASGTIGSTALENTYGTVIFTGTYLPVCTLSA